MVTTIIELFLVSSVVAIFVVAVIWWISRLVASFLEELDGSPIDDSEWYDPPHEQPLCPEQISMSDQPTFKDPTNEAAEDKRI